jgi:hypothetical protein
LRWIGRWEEEIERGRGWRRCRAAQGSLSLRLSATVTPNFFPLYHFFPLFFPLFFHLPQRFPLNTSSIPHYHYKISFSIPTINFLSTNNYSWTHSTVFRVMNSDTLDLEGERRGPARRGRCRRHRCGRGVPPTAPCKGRGKGREMRCAQPKRGEGARVIEKGYAILLLF